MTTHCQICGRAIKANTGLIAHHGYQRPYHAGYQTTSCSGARYRPYEVACDAIPPHIKALETLLPKLQQDLREHVETPPRGLRHQDLRYGTKVYPRSVLRPHGFSPDAHPSYRSDAYDTLWRGRKRSLEQSIAGVEQDLDYLRKRLADWKAPEENAA